MVNGPNQYFLNSYLRIRTDLNGKSYHTFINYNVKKFGGEGMTVTDKIHLICGLEEISG